MTLSRHYRPTGWQLLVTHSLAALAVETGAPWYVVPLILALCLAWTEIGRRMVPADD